MRKWLLNLTVSGGILGLLFWRARVWQLGDVFQDFEVWAGVVVLTLNIPILLMIALRSWLVIRRIDGDVSFRGVAPIAVVGNLAGQLTPANAGDLWRAYAYKRRYGVPVSQGAAAVVYERVFSFYLAVVGAAGIGVYQLWLTDVGVAILPAVGIVVLLLAILPSVLYGTLRGLMSKATSIAPVDSIIEKTPLGGLRTAFGEGEKSLRLLSEDRRLAWGFVAATAVYFTLATVQVWTITTALHLGVGLHEAWLVLSLSVVAGAVSALPFGLGVTDGGLVLLLRTLDVAVGPAAALAILLRALQTLPLGLAAILLYAFRAQVSPSEVGRPSQALAIQKHLGSRVGEVDERPG